ncbi:MAG: hypothetical protein IPG67_07235 [Acidobacteria bacterium]|nr:hypothetical protein [Acidobacteriota bacterium]
MKLRYLLLFTAVLLGIGNVQAQDTPSELRSVVGARASSGETTLQRLGYKFVKTTEGEDRKWSNWWKSSSKTCITVATLEGRYDSIVIAPALDCDQGNGSGSTAGIGSDQFEDLVGARASGGESELKNRGFKFIKTVKQDGRAYSNWWKASSKVCLTVATVEGRYDSIVKGPEADCTSGAGPSAGTSSQVDLRDLVGSRAPGAETEMESRGFRNVKGRKVGSTSYTYWKNEETGQCVQFAVRNGKVGSILRSNIKNCK